MNIIGVTGYSGTGKSTAAKMITEKMEKAKYINCDDWMHLIPTQFKDLMIKYFGKDKVESGKSAGQLLGIIFQDIERGPALFKEIMPWMNKQLLNEIEKAQADGFENIICDWALLPALEIWSQCDLRVKVDSPTQEERYEQLLGRSFSKRSDVIANLTAEEKTRKYTSFKERDNFVDAIIGVSIESDVVVENNYDSETLEKRISELCRKITFKGRLTDTDIQDMLDGKKSNFLLREGICGIDLSDWDLSDLSPEFFRKLCFDSNTKFSEEQIQKFNPQELLEMAKTPSQEISKLHSQGIAGQGLRVAVIDTNIDSEHEIFSSGNIHKKSSSSIGSMEVHGLTVVSALSQIVPDAQIDYYPYDKSDKENKDSVREEIIEEIIKSGVKIISMSSSFDSEDTRKRVLEKCKIAGATLIDQPAFTEHFTFCFRDIDENGEEHFEEAFMESEKASLSEEEWKKGKEIYQNLLRKYRVTDRETLTEMIRADLNIDKKTKEEMLNRLDRFGQLLECEHYEGDGGVRHVSKQQTIQEELAKKQVSRDKKPVEIACGGRSFASPDGYKYWGTCSNSYTIPQIAGLYALARQTSPNLTFEQFSEFANQTAIQIEDRLVISPENLIERVKQIENISMFHDQKIEGSFRVIETGVHTITSQDIKKVAKKDEVVAEKENAMEVRAREEKDREDELKQANSPNLE